MIVLHAGRERRSYSAHLELARAANSADPTIRRFCALIQALPRKERRLWDTARVRDFSIGVQSGKAPYSCDIVVKPETAAAVAELGARIVFTVYAPHDDAGPDRG